MNEERIVEAACVRISREARTMDAIRPALRWALAEQRREVHDEIVRLQAIASDHPAIRDALGAAALLVKDA